MLKARRNPILTALLFGYVGRRMKKSFFSYRMRVDAEWMENPNHYPLILFGNHNYWWDGLFEIPLFRQFDLDYRIMMEEANLRQFPFFRHTGVFGVDLTNSTGRSASLLHAARLLREPVQRRTLVIYPHGKLIGPMEDWPRFLGGVEALARWTQGKGHLLPLYKTIVPGPYPLPEAFLSLGTPIPCRDLPDLEQLEASLDSLRKQTHEWIRKRNFNDALVWQPPPRRYRGATGEQNG